VDDSVDFLTTEQVATLAGVGATAVKRWADAAALPCHRTAGGHRRFRRSEVEAFLRSRGMTVTARLPMVAHAPAEVATPGAIWAERLLADADPRVLEGQLLAERGGLGAWYRVADAVADGLVELGHRWSTGEVSIIEEHLASGRLARALAGIGAALPFDPGAPRAVLACAEGDEHTLGLALAEVCVREAGWHALWVGRRAPVAELAKVIAAREARLVVVTASRACEDARDLARQAELLGSACAAAGVALVLGGGGPWPAVPASALRLHSFESFHRALEGLR
jgi:excisionase family DNA binding protein